MAALLSKAIGPVRVAVIEDEQHTSTIEITEIPIETGASITDHAYRNPNKVKLKIVSEGPAVTYRALKSLQESRVPFTLVTGLHVYQNMLIKSLTPERNSRFSSVFYGTVDLQEAIIAGTSYIAGQGAHNKGQPGGANSVRSAAPARARAADAVTAVRASNTIAAGDNVTMPASGSSRSILKRILN